MYIIMVIMLGALLSIGMTGLWQQMSSLCEATIYCYKKEQRMQYAQGILAYAVGLFNHNGQVREAVKRFGRYEMAYNPPYAFPGPQIAYPTIIYEIIDIKELLVTVVVVIDGARETLAYRLPCPVRSF